MRGRHVHLTDNCNLRIIIVSPTQKIRNLSLCHIKSPRLMFKSWCKTVLIKSSNYSITIKGMLYRKLREFTDRYNVKIEIN